MASDFATDLLGPVDDGRPAKKRGQLDRRTRTHGPLHDLLTAKLPDLRHDVSGKCDLRKLAKARGISVAAVYKWFRPNHPNRLPSGQVDFLVDLSSRQKTGGKDFKPLTRDDLWEFVDL